MPELWEGVVEVCNTCNRKAQWPFCEHRTDGRWYRLVRVREVGSVKQVGSPEHPHGGPERWREDGKCRWKSCNVWREKPK